jgi:hypothetical protein
MRDASKDARFGEIFRHHDHCLGGAEPAAARLTGLVASASCTPCLSLLP